MNEEKQQDTTIDQEPLSKTAPEESAESNTPKLPPNVTEKSRRWLPYVITFAVLTAATLLVAWAVGGYTSTNTWVLLGSWGDAFAISGVFGLSAGVLVWASNGGAFDIFAYGGRAFIRRFKKDYKDHKYPTYYDYREAKKAKKRSFLYMIIIGAAFLLIGGVLLIVYSLMKP